MKQIITSLDVGSDKVKLVVSEIYNEKTFVLACSEITSKGIKKGFVVDPEQAIISLKECFKRTSEVLGIKINNVILTVPSYSATFIKSEGYTSINRENKIINGDDILRALQACVYNKVSANKELINIMPVEFVINEKDIVKDPKGIEASRLTANAVLGLVPKKNVFGILQVLESLDIKVTDICFGGLADYYAHKNEKMDNTVNAIINIGNDKTEISIINEGILIATSVLDIAGKNIDRDIAYVYDIKRKEANKIKEKFSLAHKKNASTSDTMEILTKNGDNIKINQYEVSEIVYERLKEILELSKKEINILTKKEISYIIVTGGVTEIDDFNLVLDETIKDATIGNIKELGIRNNKFSSVLGAGKYYKEKLNFRNKIASTISEEEQEEMFLVKKKFNSNILGKIYGYFFDN